MTSKKKVDNIFCSYCDNKLDFAWMKSTKAEKMYFCDQEHSTLWREENGIFHKMSKAGKAGREAAVPHLKETGHYKAMSDAGRDARSKAVAQSNREKPRRRKNHK